MGWQSILRKDLREHGLALSALATGLILVVLMSLAQHRAGEFHMSGFEVVRFALLTIIPLIALITGNRLIVREYTGGTRRFVESLPLQPATPLLVKYLLGWIYLLLLGIALVCIAALLADAAEFIDSRYVLILLTKTCAIISLYWSIVYFASLTGKLRLLIYLILAMALLLLINLPAFDASRFAPMALLEHQIFIFERDNFPWIIIAQTIGLAALISIVAFALALINEGSVAEQLGKPLSARNIAALTVLGLGILGVYSKLAEKHNIVKEEFTGTSILRNASPAIEVSYLVEELQPQAAHILENLSDILSRFQEDTSVTTLPLIQVAYNQSLERTELYPEYGKGVLVTANFEEYNDYENSMLYTVAIHHTMLILTNSRWDYETRHWILDGLAWWWAEGAQAAQQSPNNPEHFTRALVAQRRIAAADNPLATWQRLTDAHGFEATGSLAYTALLYLAQIKGDATVIELAEYYLTENPGSSSFESISILANRDADRFEAITGIGFTDFTEDWLEWLAAYATDPEVRELLSLVPAMSGTVTSTMDANGVYWLQGSYQPLTDELTAVSGTCVLRHQSASPYDLETEIYKRERDRQPCAVNKIVHKVESPYSAGDRSYAVLEFEHERFARSIPLWSGRVTIK